MPSHLTDGSSQVIYMPSYLTYMPSQATYMPSQVTDGLAHLIVSPLKASSAPANGPSGGFYDIIPL